jgi:mRNA interferase HicA
MNGNELIKRLNRLGKRQRVAVRYKAHGKGSHGRIYFGERFATLKDRKKEIGKGLLRAMCNQLGIDPKDLEG